MIQALFLSPEAPFPLIGGGPMRSASLLQYLTTQMDASVHAILFREPSAPDPALAMPKGRVCKLDVVPLPHHSKRSGPRFVRNALRLARNRPPLIDRFSGFELEISRAIGGATYDVAAIEHFWCASYVRLIRPHARRIVLDLHNVESAWHASLAARQNNAHAFALRRFSRAALALERQLLPSFDSILVTSDKDRELVEAIHPGLSVTVYPNALPPVSAPPRAEQGRIVFSGNMEYPPNIDAVRFFRASVWPLLRSHENLHWRIVGKNPDSVRPLVGDDPRVELTGFVEDALSELAAAQVAVVPILSGSGTRIKILEAWAASTPVVSTTQGAEGLAGRDGEHFLIADDPATFANAVLRLLDSPQERRRIGSAGRQLFERCYTWPIAWRSLPAAFGNVATAE